MARAIKFKNNDYLDATGVIYQNAKYNSKKTVSSLLQMQACQIYVSSRYVQEVPTAWTRYKINCNTIMYREGPSYNEQLWMENNGIRIGKGINKVLVMANLCHLASSGGQFDIQIQRNNDTMISLYGYIDTAGINNKSAQTIFDVSEGDIIYLWMHTGTTGNHTIYERTNLTVLALA